MALTLDLIGKALVVWIGILLLAVVNGGFREAILIPILGRPSAFILSGILLSAIILAVAYISLSWFGRVQVEAYTAIGLGWLSLTLTFEFTFGRLIQGQPWLQLFEAYTFRGGNIWPIVLLITAMAPYIAAKVRGFL